MAAQPWRIRFGFASSPLSGLRLLGGIDLGDVGDEVEDTAGVTPLVVVPGDQLDEVVVEGDTGLGIEDGGVGVAVKVRGDNIVLGVGENACQVVVSSVSCRVTSVEKHTLELVLGRSLDGLLDLVVRSTLLEADSQVDNGDVGGGDTHGHAGELAVELGDDLADSLGGTSAGGDDVLGSATATSPVLGGGTINGLLGGSVGVDSGHETLNDAELVVDDLGEGSQAVGGARSVGDDVGRAVVLLVVDTDDVHGGIGRRGRDDNLLGATDKMGLGLLGGGEDTSGLDDVLGAGVSPGDGRGVTLRVELDSLAVDDEVVTVVADLTLEDTVGGVVLEHVDLERGWSAWLMVILCSSGETYGVVRLNEGVVHSNNLDLGVLDGVAEDDTADTTETVDADLDGSHFE